MKLNDSDNGQDFELEELLSEIWIKCRYGE